MQTRIKNFPTKAELSDTNKRHWNVKQWRQWYFGGNVADPQARKDIQKIAAASELFDACVAALKLLRNCAFTENQPTLTQVRTAIAKAEGE